MRALPLLLALGCTPPGDSGRRETGDPDSAPGDSGETGETGGPEACVPDGDGRVGFEEFAADPALGITVAYTTNAPGSTVPVAGLAGVAGEDGRRTWDFTAAQPGTDQTWQLGLMDPAGAWFAAAFPGATYAVGLDASERVLGVYRLDPDLEQLLLLGLAAADGASGELLVYERPVVVFDFPIALGGAWEATAVQADGRWEEVDYPADYGWAGVVTLEHSYAFAVDAAGTLRVPLGDFEVLRVRADQRMEAVNSISGPFASESFIAYFFVAECAGLAARVRSVEGEREADFAQASEYLRLGF